MGWKVQLNNGEVHTETVGKVSCWRELRNYCAAQKLKIEKMWYNNEILDQRAQRYFVFFHAEAHIRTGFMLQKKAVGIVRSYKDKERDITKAYIDWYLLPDDTKIFNERTVRTKESDVNAWEIIDDISIPAA